MGAHFGVGLVEAEVSGGTLVLMSKFYAPYFFTNVDMGALQEAAHGYLLEAAKDMARKLIGAMASTSA